jgi:hypothetical protein
MTTESTIACLYGNPPEFIDVTHKVLTVFRVDNNLVFSIGEKGFNGIFSDPCKNKTKTLYITIQNPGSETRSYTIPENNYETHIIPLSNHKCDLICEYGTPIKYLDVTDVVQKTFQQGSLLYFKPGLKKFNELFSDPVPNNLKALMITVPATETSPSRTHVIYENDVQEHVIRLFDRLITFIIPTIGRDSLIETLTSLEAQTDPGWEAICIFDNVQPNPVLLEKLQSNPKFQYYILEKKLGQGKNSGGAVRNYGMQYVTTEWLGFVDDDDTLLPHYVASLKTEISTSPTTECIIFRMIANGFPLPPAKTAGIAVNKVGISFCYKTVLFLTGFQFNPSNIEDYDLLNRIRLGKKKITIAPYITYNVNNNTIPDHFETLERQTNRVIIN